MWNVCINREFAELNIHRMNMNLTERGLSPLIHSAYKVGWKNLENHPHWYHIMPSQDLLDDLYGEGSVKVKDVVRNVVVCTEVSEDPADISTYPVIWDLCRPEMRGHDPKIIHYKNDLEDSILLTKDPSFHIEGFLKDMKYTFDNQGHFEDYQDGEYKVIDTHEEYITNPGQSGNAPCTREPISRIVTRTWYNWDGTVYLEHTKPKVYVTQMDKTKEAQRRRANLKFTMSETVIELMIFSGVITPNLPEMMVENGKVLLRTLSKVHAVALGQYIDVGDIELMSELVTDAADQNTANPWLNATIQPHPDMVAKYPHIFDDEDVTTFLDYIIKKLRGEIL